MTQIVRIDWAPLAGKRPRASGANSRVSPDEAPALGVDVRVPIARVTLADGSTGFGYARVALEQAQALLGATLDSVFDPSSGATERALPLDYPLWDLAARRAGVPAYALAASGRGVAQPEENGVLSVPCYDTSLYFDDLNTASDEEAASLMGAEARQGWERGHRAFKMKVGRGARFMPSEEGTRRDVAVVRGVRDAVGPQAPIMIDANNGYTLNVAKRVLAETADCGIFWLEEAFHEDPVLYQDLRRWLDKEGIPALIADGEGQAAPALMDWARDHTVDVVQYDILHPGFTRWLEIGTQLDAWNVRSAPHHYGRHYGNYVAGHLSAVIRSFTYVEWDEATTPGLDTSAYRLEEGRVLLPATPGFGLTLESDIFERAVKESGFSVTV